MLCYFGIHKGVLIFVHNHPSSNWASWILDIGLVLQSWSPGTWYGATFHVPGTCVPVPGTWISFVPTVENPLSRSVPRSTILVPRLNSSGNFVTVTAVQQLKILSMIEVLRCITKNLAEYVWICSTVIIYVEHSNEHHATWGPLRTFEENPILPWSMHVVT
jgi:hypothetical protein